MNLEARLKRLAAAIAAKRQQQSEQPDQALQSTLERVSLLSDDELLAEYNALMSAPPTPEMAAMFEGMNAQQLINNYFRLIRQS